MHELFVKQRYMEALVQFWTKLYHSRWYICPAMDEPWKVPMQTEVILFLFRQKNGPILQRMLQNMNKSLQMQLIKAWICSLIVAFHASYIKFKLWHISQNSGYAGLGIIFSCI